MVSVVDIDKLWKNFDWHRRQAGRVRMTCRNCKMKNKTDKTKLKKNRRIHPHRQVVGKCEQRQLTIAVFKSAIIFTFVYGSILDIQQRLLMKYGNI